MEHRTASVPSHVRQVIGNLIAFPFPSTEASIADTDEKPSSRHSRLHTKLDLQEKEEELQKLNAALSARSAELQKKEQQLNERWDAGRIYEIPTDDIAANPAQPRREFEDLSLFSLANSIREHGLLQPITVRRCPAPAADKNKPADEPTKPYQLIAGERRLRAAVSLGMKTIPCIILNADNRRAAELALIENLQRENLNLFEQAGAIAALIDIHAMTQEEIARSLSVSQSCIANKLRILRLTSEEREIILSSHLTERHARAFLRIRDLGLRRETVRKTAERGLNVAQTEQYIDALLTAHPIRCPSPAAAPQMPSDAEFSGAEPAAADRPTVRQRKCILKDLRFFFNTIDHAVAAACEAGFHAECARDETDDRVTVTVTIRRGYVGGCPDTGAAEQESTEFVSRETENMR